MSQVRGEKWAGRRWLRGVLISEFQLAMIVIARGASKKNGAMKAPISISRGGGIKNLYLSTKRSSESSEENFFF